MKKTNKFFIYFSTLLLCLLLSSCGTVVHKTDQKMTINSVPNKADVQINGFTVGQTPCTVKVDRQSSNAIITVSKNGYQSYTTVAESKVSGWFWGNAIWSYLFPFSSTTDAYTGGMYEYDRDSFFVNLEQIGTNNNLYTFQSNTSDSNKSAIKKFVLTNYHEINQEISRQQVDEVLSTLKELMGFSNFENDTFMMIIEKAISKSDNADQLAEILIQKTNR